MELTNEFGGKYTTCIEVMNMDNGDVVIHMNTSEGLAILKALPPCSFKLEKSPFYDYLTYNFAIPKFPEYDELSKLGLTITGTANGDVLIIPHITKDVQQRRLVCTIGTYEVHVSLDSGLLKYSTNNIFRGFLGWD